MMNPIRWFFRRRQAKLARKKLAADAIALRATENTGARLAQTVTDELSSFLSSLVAGQERLEEKLGGALDELKAITVEFESSLSAATEELNKEVGRLREATEERFKALEERVDRVEQSVSRAAGKSDELEQGFVRLAAVVERQLGSTERSLKTLQETGERRVSEIRETYRRHFDTLERSTHNVLKAAKQSRERLGRRVQEIADYLEKENWPAVPGPSEPFAFAMPNESVWRHPLRVCRRWFARGLQQRRTIVALQSRNSNLEDVLRDRREVNRQKGRILREALECEQEALPAPSEIRVKPEQGTPDPGSQETRPRRELTLEAVGARKMPLSS